MLLTVADLKSKYNGVFDDVEVFYNEGTAFRGNVSGEFEKGVSDKFEVLDFKLADEEYYRSYISDRRVPVDFIDFYGKKDAKVLCVLVPAEAALKEDKSIVLRSGI